MADPSRRGVGEVVELMQGLHDDGDEGQVELSDVGSDLRVPVPRVCIMAAQQGVNSTNGFFMKEENPFSFRIKHKREFCKQQARQEVLLSKRDGELKHGGYTLVLDHTGKC